MVLFGLKGARTGSLASLGYRCFVSLMSGLASPLSLAAKLHDLRDPARVKHSQASLLRSWTYIMAASNSTESATSELHFDPVLRMAASGCRGLSPLDDDGGVLASQPTFLRLLGALAAPENPSVPEDAIFDSAARAMHAVNGGEKLEPITLDMTPFRTGSMATSRALSTTSTTPRAASIRLV